MSWQYFVIFGGIVCQGVRVNFEQRFQQTPSCKLVHWNLCDNIQAVHSNLFGAGPNNSDVGSLDEFRVPKIATVRGMEVDLVVTVADGETYRSFGVENKRNGGGAYVSKTEPQPYNGVKTVDVWGQGDSPCWISFPWHTQTHTKLQWRFVKTGTSEVVPVQKFRMRIADFDAQARDTEYVEFNTPPATIAPGMDVLHSQNGGIERIANIGSGTVHDNPTRVIKAGCTPTAADPYSCITDVQKARSVEVTYENVGEWEMTIGAEGNAQADRALQIYGQMCKS